jgi:hypothetical protein
MDLTQDRGQLWDLELAVLNRRVLLEQRLANQSVTYLLSLIGLWHVTLHHAQACTDFLFIYEPPTKTMSQNT